MLKRGLIAAIPPQKITVVTEGIGHAGVGAKPGVDHHRLPVDDLTRGELDRADRDRAIVRRPLRFDAEVVVGAAHVEFAPARFEDGLGDRHGCGDVEFRLRRLCRPDACLDELPVRHLDTSLPDFPIQIVRLVNRGRDCLLSGSLIDGQYNV